VAKDGGNGDCFANGNTGNRASMNRTGNVEKWVASQVAGPQFLTQILNSADLWIPQSRPK
jgi:hypothetical protein